jgi:hypothetical protein
MDFTTGQAQGLVIGATAAATILASAANLADGNPPDIRTAIGGTIAAAFLYALADVAPALAGSFALLLLLGAILTNGVTVANIITKATASR